MLASSSSKLQMRSGSPQWNGQIHCHIHKEYFSSGFWARKLLLLFAVTWAILIRHPPSLLTLQTNERIWSLTWKIWIHVTDKSQQISFTIQFVKSGKKLLYSNTVLFSKIEPSWGINQSNCFLFVILLVFVTGKMIRRRTVNQPFQGDGRPCPSQMEQFKPCPVKPCYRWQYGQWSACKVEVKAIWDFEVMELEDPGIFVMYPDTSLSTL